MGQCEESLIAGGHNQVRFPLPGTLADAAHDEALGSERPVIGIQIFSSDIGFNSPLSSPFSKFSVRRLCQGVFLYRTV